MSISFCAARPAVSTPAQSETIKHRPPVFGLAQSQPSPTRHDDPAGSLVNALSAFILALCVGGLGLQIINGLEQRREAQQNQRDGALTRESKLDCNTLQAQDARKADIPGLPEDLELVFDKDGHPRLCPKK